MESPLQPQEVTRALDALEQVSDRLGRAFDQAARESLRVAGQRFFWLRGTVDQTPRPAETRKRLERIARAAETFTQALEGLPEDMRVAISPGWRDQLPSGNGLAASLMLHYEHRTRQEDRLKVVGQGVIAMGGEAGRLATLLAGAKKPRMAAETTFICDLGEIYRRATGRAPGLSRHYEGGDFGGPFYRLAKGCLEALGVEHSGWAAWGKAIERGLALYKESLPPE